MADDDFVVSHAQTDHRPLMRALRHAGKLLQKCVVPFAVDHFAAPFHC